MKYEYWLSRLTSIAAQKRMQARLLAGTAKDFYGMGRKGWEKMHIFKEDEIECISRSRCARDVDADWDAFQKTKIRLVPFWADDYPDRLKPIYCPPYAVYVRGKLPEGALCVGVVGARMCSEYGRSIARMLGRRLGDCKIGVISGMALGVDSAAHAGALEANGETFAVLGCGCDVVYPRASEEIYRSLVRSGGLISEYPPGSAPTAWHFPMRNRIISALSDVLVVVEAQKRSGSLITADFALEQGKDIYAVPGRLSDRLSEGCNRLIAQGAGILCDVDEWLEQIGGSRPKSRDCKKNASFSLEKEERLVYSCLDFHPKFTEDIAEESGLDLAGTQRALAGLKKKKLVQETFQNHYCRRV